MYRPTGFCRKHIFLKNHHRLICGAHNVSACEHPVVEYGFYNNILKLKSGLKYLSKTWTTYM